MNVFTDSLKDVVRRLNAANRKSGLQKIVVRRSDVFTDVLREFSRKRFDPEKELQVSKYRCIHLTDNMLGNKLLSYVGIQTAYSVSGVSSITNFACFIIIALLLIVYLNLIGSFIISTVNGFPNRLLPSRRDSENINCM